MQFAFEFEEEKPDESVWIFVNEHDSIQKEEKDKEPK